MVDPYIVKMTHARETNHVIKNWCFESSGISLISGTGDTELELSPVIWIMVL